MTAENCENSKWQVHTLLVAQAAKTVKHWQELCTAGTPHNPAMSLQALLSAHRGAAGRWRRDGGNPGDSAGLVVPW
jgi:hypothetical protein